MFVVLVDANQVFYDLDYLMIIILTAYHILSSFTGIIVLGSEWELHVC